MKKYSCIGCRTEFELADLDVTKRCRKCFREDQEERKNRWDGNYFRCQLCDTKLPTWKRWSYITYNTEYSAICHGCIVSLFYVNPEILKKGRHIGADDLDEALYGQDGLKLG